MHWNSSLRIGSLYFLIVFAAGFVLGVLRTLVLAPAMGELAATMTEVPFLLLFSWMVSRRLHETTPDTSTYLDRLISGGVALGLLLIAEAGLSLGLSGRTLGEHLRLYTQLPHQVGLVGQILFGGFPLIQKWIRDRRGPRPV